MIRAGVTSTPVTALMRAKVCGVGGSTAMPRVASGSTTMVAPPAVVVTTATVGRLTPRAAAGTRASSGKPSISPSSVSTRAMPHSARNMPAMSSSPASAPVCETASSRAAAERPSL